MRPTRRFGDLSGYGQSSQNESVQNEHNLVEPCADARVCGPEIYAALRATIMKTQIMFLHTWDADAQNQHCHALLSPDTASGAWDLVDLRNDYMQWVPAYQPSCANPRDPRNAQGQILSSAGCEQTVSVNGQCYYNGTVNYVIFGHMSQLCSFWKPKMQAAILAHKLNWSGFSGNTHGSLAWANAGYDNWPFSKTGDQPPAGDKMDCVPSCPKPFNRTTFQVHWTPGVF